MSFRLFIYYCSLSGALSALCGWGLGRFLAHGDGAFMQGLKGLYLALCLAFALSLIDALWNVGLGKPLSVLARVLCAVFVGVLAGMLAGLISEALFGLFAGAAAHNATHRAILDTLGAGFRVFGYTFIGLLIGASLGLFDLLHSLLTNRSATSAIKKIRNGLIGGTMGGIVGGILSVMLGAWWTGLLEGKPRDLLLSPSAAAFAALGLFIGFLIGLAQVMLKEAWLKVEQGFRPGRELILSRDLITIGRAESCDIGLFGDPTVEKQHARIERQGNAFVVVDLNTPGGTFVNDVRVSGPRLLMAGDSIRVGRCVLRFGERAKK